MEYSEIKIIREFKEYAYYNPIGIFKGLKKTETDINIFGNQIAICVSEEDIPFYVWFGIVGDIFNTKKKNVVKISSNSFTLSNIKDSHTAYFQNYLDRFFMMLSYSKRSKEAQSLSQDMYGDDILHIYGIWEIELPEDFKDKIFR